MPKDALGNVVWGKYVCPSYNAFYNLLRHRNKKTGRYDFDVADFAAHLSKWMTAQAGRLPRHLAADGKFVDEVVGLVSVVDAGCGDYVLQVKGNQKGVLRQCEELSRIRPLVNSSKKRAEPGAAGDPQDEGVPRPGRGRGRAPRRPDDRQDVPGGLADAEDREEGQARQGHPQARRQADEGGRLARHGAPRHVRRGQEPLNGRD